MRVAAGQPVDVQGDPGAERESPEKFLYQCRVETQDRRERQLDIVP